MTPDLQDLLARRADSIDAPIFDPLAVVAAGERRIRRRGRITAAGVALTLIVAAGVSALVVDRGSHHTAPSERPGLTWSPGTRPVTYGQGQTLHLGVLEVDTGIDFLSVDVTDDGAALTTLDGGIWFTDGRTVERIGGTLGASKVRRDSVSWAAGWPPAWVITDSAGSLLAWLEPTRRADRRELVVYDTAERAVLARSTIEVADGNAVTALALAGREVLLSETSQGSSVPVALLRYDVDTDVLEGVDGGDVAAARRGVSRALVVGTSAEGGALIDWDGGSDGTGTPLTVHDSRLETLFDPRTGGEVDLRVAAGYEPGVLWVVQWLDDDRFTLIAGNRAPVGDLLACRISEGRCDVLLDRSVWATAPILPGVGSVGAELSLARAMQSAVEKWSGS